MIDDKEVIALAPRYPGIDLTSVAAFAFSLRCDRTEPLLDHCMQIRVFSVEKLVENSKKCLTMF